MICRSDRNSAFPYARRGGRIPWGKHAGFTLLELLVVIILLALTAGITAANFQRGTPGAELESEARKLISLMRYMRARSMSEGTIFAIEADDDVAGYRTGPDEKEFQLPHGMSIACDPEHEMSGINLSGIHFYPDGSSSGGLCQLSIASGERYIEVSWLTGGIRFVKPEL
jgi:general secretion pathway protein H